ncbi:hypothetical protein JXO59_16445 [candidate division KSB1 bacterium]|nr:hypothetical protein [candidate division KSB1 bacterium]
MIQEEPECFSSKNKSGGDAGGSHSGGIKKVRVRTNKWSWKVTHFGGKAADF